MITGEEVKYHYDTLARLTRAETVQTGGTQWGQQFGYDGFGNLLSKTVTKGSAPVMNLIVNGLTNRITTAGFAYDAAGNMTQMPYSSSSQTLDYDLFGRVTTVTNTDGVQTYGYDWRGHRWSVTKGGQTEYFLYLPDGRLLGRYRRVTGSVRYQDGTESGPQQVWQAAEVFYYFGGRLVSRKGGFGQPLSRITTDRLGSVGDGSAHHPYGEDRTAAANDQFKFATYWRDGQSGLDYAQQRHYMPGYGRFTSVDPADGSASPTNPGTWNRYQYADFDPANKVDPQGTWASNLASIEWTGDASIADGGCNAMGFAPGSFCTSQVAFAIAALFPPRASAEDDCFVEMWHRPVRLLGVETPARHLYLLVRNHQEAFTVEGGPDLKDWPVGYLVGTVAAVGSGRALEGTDPHSTTNAQLGTRYRGDSACDKAARILARTSQYNSSGSWVPYDASARVSFNSNSFAYTLMRSVGLHFGSPPLGAIQFPGWGQTVPWL